MVRDKFTALVIFVALTSTHCDDRANRGLTLDGGGDENTQDTGKPVGEDDRDRPTDSGSPSDPGEPVTYSDVAIDFAELSNGTVLSDQTASG